MWARGAGVSAMMIVLWALPILLGALLSPASADLASQGLLSLTDLSSQVLNKTKKKSQKPGRRCWPKRKALRYLTV